MNFLNTLNQEQKEAVINKNGIFLVHAGAGSGKTRVITARIANLIINYNTNPESILALTFTNKAANQMKERVIDIINSNNNIHSSLPYLGTFHSYCLRLLKSSKYFANHNFSLIDEEDQNRIIKNIIKNNNLDKKITPKQVLYFISKIKNDSPYPEKSLDFNSAISLFKDLYYLYEKEKVESNYLDFDDLLIKTYLLFKENIDFKINFQERIKHILVDEYQDTNKIQHMLIKAMTLDNDNNFVLESLCAVGDEDQSIYSWRGAEVINMFNFKKDFKDTISIKLEQNYRSVQPILLTANNIIKNNKIRNEKNLWSNKIASDCIRVIACKSNYHEANAVSIFIKEMNKKNKYNNAILYRSHFQSRAIEEALIRSSIAYKIIGGIQFYNRQEIKDLISYLKLFVNKKDKLAFNRIINTPHRGLGEKFEDLFLQIWQDNSEIDFIEVSNYIINSKLLNKNKENYLIEFIEIFEKLNKYEKASDLLNTIISETKYLNYLEQNFEKQEYNSKKENIKELINSAIHFENNNKNFTVNNFLEEIALLQDLINANDNVNEKIYLMTFHAAKGLEFDNVIITGTEEGILPSSHSNYNQEALEEERRLMYVGITRAKEKLLITYSYNRNIYGQVTYQKKSRFLDELPKEHISYQDCSYYSDTDFEFYFKNWLNLENKDLNYKYINQETNKLNNNNNNCSSNNNIYWKIKDTVSHPKFGQGIIEKIENNILNTYLIVKFKDFIKKIDAKFINKI